MSGYVHCSEVVLVENKAEWIVSNTSNYMASGTYPLEANPILKTVANSVKVLHLIRVKHFVIVGTKA